MGIYRLGGIAGLFLVALALVSVSCVEEDPAAGGWTVEEGEGGETEYGDDSTVIAQPGETDTAVIVSGDGEGCVELEDGSCVDPGEAKDQAAEDGEQYCDDPDAQADVLLNDDGEVVDVICYPPKDDGTDIRETNKDDEGNTEVPQTENGTVVTFGEDTNGEPIEGDVRIDSERTTLYGNGVDNTIIDGNVTVASNNARIRGMTISGNVTFEQISNESALSFCKIEGNLTVNSNGFTANNCQVFGNVDVSGNGATLINVGVQGEWNVNPDADCMGCYSLSDENDDGDVADSEVGDDLTCDGAPDNPGM